MSKTPQRLSSIATPTRDKIVIYSAIAAGCGILALLGRHAAINSFGTDHFTGNVLFVVFLFLTFGLFVGFQSMLEELFRKLPNPFRRQEIAIAETTSGEQIAVPIIDETILQNGVESPSIADVKEQFLPSYEILEVVDDMRHIRFPDGIEAYVGMGLSDEEIFAKKQYDDSRDWDVELAEIERQAYKEMSDQERYDYDNNITRVHKEKEYDDALGCFSAISSYDEYNNSDGSTLIEEYEETVYLSEEGNVYFLPEIDEIVRFYESHKDNVEAHTEIISQHQKCDEEYEKLKEADEQYNQEQVEFICAYLTYSLQQFLDGHELQKLHHNAKIWTKNSIAKFIAVKLRSNHLSKDDLKHIGYNIGKFLRLKGPIISRFVKNVFEETFDGIQLGTINSKLANKDPKRDRIPLLSANAMDQLFVHYKRYGKINLSIIKEEKKK